MKGIDYIVDEEGHRRAVVIDLGLHEDLWEAPRHNFVIDLTTRIGEAFEFTDVEHSPVELHGQNVPVATARMLVRMKRKSTREKDRSDAARLCERHGIEEP
jgi:hypothetical protein